MEYVIYRRGGICGGHGLQGVEKVLENIWKFGKNFSKILQNIRENSGYIFTKIQEYLSEIFGKSLYFRDNLRIFF